MGERDESQRSRAQGSIFEWNDSGVVYDGWASGRNEFFANLGGQGRADLVKVDPRSGHVSWDSTTCFGIEAYGFANKRNAGLGEL